MPKIGQPTTNGIPRLLPEKRRERLAVNLFDLDRIEPSIRQIVLSGKLDLRAIRVDDKRPDETAVAFSCDLLTAAAVCDVLRSNDRKLGDYPTRVYVRRLRVWDKLPADTVLTDLDSDGRIQLNPDVFVPEAGEAVPPPVKRVSFKRPSPVVGPTGPAKNGDET